MNNFALWGEMEGKSSINIVLIPNNIPFRLNGNAKEIQHCSWEMLLRNDGIWFYAENAENS